MRGVIFTGRNTRLVVVATFSGLFTYALVPFFGNMVANGAFARISNRTFDSVVLSFNLVGFIGMAFLAALMSTVFAVGERMQRDSEGLV